MHSLIDTRLRAARRLAATITQVRRPIGMLFVLGSLLLWTGCSREKSPSPTGANLSTSGSGGPQISAVPNPVPASSEKFGKTMISWNTGDGSVGEVYVSVNGGPEKLFAGNRSKGSMEAPWIGKGDHQFRLYAGTQHSKVLASISVTKSKK